MRAQLKALKRPGGAIVNVAWSAGIRGLPNIMAYCISKWGVNGFIVFVAAEYGRAGI